MTGNLRHINNVINQQSFSKVERVENVKEKNTAPLVHESCNFSNFSLVAAAAGILTFAGIILYALVV